MKRHDEYGDDEQNGTGDFWGDKADWSTSSEPTTEHERFDAAAHWADRADLDATRPVARIRHGLSKLLGSGTDATREHGIVRPSAAGPTRPAGAVSPDMFDDLDDLPDTPARTDDHAGDYSYDDTAGWGTADVYDDTGWETADVGPASTASASDHRDAHRIQAHSTQADSVQADWDAELTPTPIDGRDRVTPAGRLDPLLVRAGAVAVVASLLVPVLLSMSSDDSADVIKSTVSTELEAASTTLLPTTTAAASADATEVQLDPNDLPPAVPVNTSAEVATTVGAESPVAEIAAADSTVTAALTDEAELAAAATTTTATATATTEVATTPSNDGNSNGAATPSSDEPAVETPAAADEPADRIERTCAIDYTVVAGDWWIRLANASGVELDALLEANGASASTPLYPGDEICLPAGATTPAPPPPPTTPAPTTTAAPTTTQAPTTTVAPTTTQPTTTQPSSPAGPEDIKQIIRDVWPDELEEQALEIAFRESRYVPTAKNFCCYGLFQIYWQVHRSWLDDIGITDDQQLYDPATNARAAYALYQRAGGWGPWQL